MLDLNIFIGFTPLHAKNAASIIDGVSGEVCCFFTKEWPKTSKMYKRLGFNISSIFILRWAAYVSNFILFTFKVKKLLKSGGNVNLYVPHPANIFSNYLFFCKEVSAVNLYEDGLLNYYDAPSGLARVNLALRILARLLSFPYKDYTGHLAGFDARKVTGVFLTRPDLAVGLDKFFLSRKLNTRNP